MKETDYLIISIVFMAISIIVIMTGCCSKKEGFDPKYSTDMKTFVDNSIYVSNVDGVLSHGTVQKFKKDNMYSYEFMYNLPDAVATLQVVDLNKAFNANMPDNKYKVFAGSSGSNMTYLGNLTRRGDGYHILHVKTDKDYSKACVVLGKDVVQCSEMRSI